MTEDEAIKTKRTAAKLKRSIEINKRVVEHIEGCLLSVAVKEQRIFELERDCNGRY